jgi:hypothetical protein
MSSVNFSKYTPLVACFFMVGAGTVDALEIKLKDRDFHLFIDSTFTASAAMRVQSGQGDSASGNNTVFANGGDVFSTPLSLITDISASKGDMGFFARASYTHDPTILKENCSNCARPTPGMLANGIHGSAQHLAGNKFRLLDFFVFNTWNFGDHPLSVRVGKQVVSWGESNIIGGGISQMQNPVDLAKATTPGTEVKETLMPQESIYLQFGLTSNITAEAYYVWNWRSSVFIPVGTFFSPFDFLGAGYKPDIAPSTPYKGRHESDEPDGGQWGLSLSTYMEAMGGMDLSIYWVRSHAFIPYLGIDSTYIIPDPILVPPTVGGYENIYTEDQDTYAVSIAGLFPGSLGISFQAELNHKPDMFDTRKCVGCPVGRSDVTTLLGGIAHSANYNVLNSDRFNLFLDVQAQRINKLDDGAGASALGGKITDFSWGYVALISLDYLDLFANIKVTPSIVWVHDVHGFEPGAAGGLTEDERAISAAVNFSYLSQTSLKITYTSWLGDNGSYYDRDNLSLTFKYNF